ALHRSSRSSPAAFRRGLRRRHDYQRRTSARVQRVGLEIYRAFSQHHPWRRRGSPAECRTAESTRISGLTRQKLTTESPSDKTFVLTSSVPPCFRDSFQARHFGR